MIWSIYDVKSGGSSDSDSSRRPPPITLPLINDQINPIRALKWFYSVVINDSSQVTFDVKEQRSVQLYHCERHV